MDIGYTESIPMNQPCVGRKRKCSRLFACWSNKSAPFDQSQSRRSVVAPESGGSKRRSTSILPGRTQSWRR